MPFRLPALTGIFHWWGKLPVSPSPASRHHRVPGVLFRLLCLLLTLAVTPSAAAIGLDEIVSLASQARQGVFGSKEIEVESLRDLPQWTRILHRQNAVETTLSACLDDRTACPSETLRRWRAAIADARALPPRNRLAVVNDFFNRWPYRSDMEVYGLREYWATPEEFMTRSGDCEDYAIAKFFTLRVLGFANDDLRIVALTDRIRGVNHAVVTVRQQDEVLVLDSLSNLILPQNRYKHYVARFSVNETTRWNHAGSFRVHEPDVFRRAQQVNS